MPFKSGAHASSAPVDVELIAAQDSSSSSHIAHASTPCRSLDIQGSVPQSSRIWKRLEATLPPAVVRWNSKAVNWIKGPSTPQKHTIKPIFESVQTFPVRLLARLPRWLRTAIYLAFFVLWAVLFAVILTNYSLPTNLAGYGKPVGLSCVTNLWPSPQSCGLNGLACLPFTSPPFAFTCPANCAGVKVLNPRAIGNTSINYRPLVIGTQTYRGDSFLCGAAIHAGAIADTQGGCGVVRLVGQKSGFASTTSHGIESVGFDGEFPLAMEFVQSEQIQRDSKMCRDPRWKLLILSTICTAVVGVCTSRPATFFAPVFAMLFFQVGMASDTPSYADYASLASIILGRFLPAALVAALFYRFSVRKTLGGCRAHVEKTVLWVGAAWVGALSNYTLEAIPIQRLTGHDIRQQPGAVTALVIIVLVLFAIILYQCWCLRVEGRLPRFLGLYALFGVGLGILSAMPHLTLRIHHYILALLLLPGTSMQTRVSLLAQGLLVGLFVNGVARWNFDSILQTAAQLRGDAQLGSVIPEILEPVINGSTITFAWKAIRRGYEGVSVIVNDVERFRGVGDEKNFTWTRRAEEVNEYFRFGFVNYAPFGGVGYSDFTRAGTWWTNGSWSGVPEGRI